CCGIVNRSLDLILAPPDSVRLRQCVRGEPSDAPNRRLQCLPLARDKLLTAFSEVGAEGTFGPVKLTGPYLVGCADAYVTPIVTRPALFDGPRILQYPLRPTLLTAHPVQHRAVPCRRTLGGINLRVT